MARWRLDVTGWHYTRRWTIGARRGEWWIGARYNFMCDWWEINLLGLTAFIPLERTPRNSPPPPPVRSTIEIRPFWS